MSSFRRYDIDALRVMAFGILILYHCGMLFVPEWGWHIKSTYQVTGLDTLMQFFNAWRMPLLFLVSGTAIALSNPQRHLSGFIKSRTFRLLFPLFMAMILTVPFQAYVQAVSNGSVPSGLGRFMLNYFTFQPWPEGAFDGSDVGFTWNHLWYLPYLFVYTTLLTALLKLKQWLPMKITNISTSAILLITAVLALCIISLKTWVRPHYPETHALYNDWFAHPYYFSFFMVGYLLGRPATADFWNTMANKRWWLLGAAVGVFGLLQLTKQVDHLNLTMWLLSPKMGELHLAGTTYALCLPTLKNILHTIYTIIMIGAILALGFKYLNKPDSAFSRYSQAIFPWYILHQTIIIVLAYWIVPIKLGVLSEAILVISGTFFGCLFIYRYIILPLPILHNAFGIFQKK